jgi:hypothetical protein
MHPRFITGIAAGVVLAVAVAVGRAVHVGARTAPRERGNRVEQDRLDRDHVHRRAAAARGCA